MWRAIESPAATRSLNKRPTAHAQSRGVERFGVDLQEVSHVIAQHHELLGSFETPSDWHHHVKSTQKPVRTPPTPIPRHKYDTEEDYNDRLVDQYVKQRREAVPDRPEHAAESYSTEEENEEGLSSAEEGLSSAEEGGIEVVPRRNVFKPILKQPAVLQNFPDMDLMGSDKQEAFSVVAHMNTTLMGQDEDEKTVALDLLPHEASERIILARPPLRPKSQWVESDNSEHGAYTTSDDVSTAYSFERSSESTIKTSPNGSRDST